jgi:CheY-like chemotaxis protein
VAAPRSYSVYRGSQVLDANAFFQAAAIPGSRRFRSRIPGMVFCLVAAVYPGERGRRPKRDLSGPLAMRSLMKEGESSDRKPARTIGDLFMKRRILLVDDEVAILLTLQAVLEINGFEVETAASAREAKLKIRTNQYHMVITDMRMESEIAGNEVVHAAKKSPYNPAVALLTAFPLPGSEGDEQDADEVLVKPMNTNDLLVQIEALLVTHEDKKRLAEERSLQFAAAGSTKASTKKAVAGQKAAKRSKASAGKKTGTLARAH